MSDIESENDKYSKDPRIACKYGTKCYQKNPIHRKKYKHPPNDKEKLSVGHINKKIRVENTNKESEEVVTSNDVSDSDDYNIEDDSDISTNKVPKISNEVSDSEPNEDENKKTDKKDEDDLNKHDQISSSKKVEVNISNDVSASEDSDDEKGNMDKQNIENSEDKNQTNEIKKVEYVQPKVQSDCKKFIKEKFLVEMPDDFYQFWEYCKRLNSKNPLEALKDVGLKLVGPFDVIACRFDNIVKLDEEYLLHWRYYHDPPEFQTVLKGDDKTGYHIGYFRDSPDELPTLLANNSAKRDGILHQMGGNIFSAVNMYLEDLKKTGDPFKKMHIGRIQASIKKEAESLKLDLSRKTPGIISREKKIVTRTFNKIGLVVPYNRKTQLGYRELALGNKDLATLFTKLQKALPEQKNKYLSELQPVFTYTNIAADECDFGTGIELGWNIISHGVDSLNSTALRFLTTNYRLLHREAFAKIADAHMSNRKKGCDLSII